MSELENNLPVKKTTEESEDILETSENEVKPMMQTEMDEEDDIPKLYSDRLIYSFSILFSVIAGGILLARNLKEVDRRDGIPHVIAFSVLYTFLSAYLLNVINVGLAGTVFFAIIGSMVLNSYFWNVYIGREMVYARKSYRKPLIIALSILIPLFLLALCGTLMSGKVPSTGTTIS